MQRIKKVNVTSRLKQASKKMQICSMKFTKEITKVGKIR